MWETIRKNMTVKQIVVWSALLIFGVSLFIMGVFNITYIIAGNATDLNEYVMEGKKPKKLDVVELDVKYVLGEYAEENKTLMGIKFKPKYHFIVVLDDGSLISLSVNDEAYIRKLNNLSTYTLNMLYGYTVEEPNPVRITGVVTGMSSKCKKLYQDSLEYIGIDKDSKFVYTLEVDTTKTRGMMAAAFSIGVILIVVGILYYRSCQNEKKFKKEQFATVGTSSLDPLSAMIQNRENATVQEESTDTYSNNSSNYSTYNGSSIDSDENDNLTEVKETATGTSKFTLKKD